MNNLGPQSPGQGPDQPQSNLPGPPPRLGGLRGARTGNSPIPGPPQQHPQPQPQNQGPQGQPQPHRQQPPQQYPPQGPPQQGPPPVQQGHPQQPPPQQQMPQQAPPQQAPAPNPQQQVQDPPPVQGPQAATGFKGVMDAIWSAPTGDEHGPYLPAYHKVRVQRKRFVVGSLIIGILCLGGCGIGSVGMLFWWFGDLWPKSKKWEGLKTGPGIIAILLLNGLYAGWFVGWVIYVIVRIFQFAFSDGYIS